MKYAVGVDIGGTKIAIALVDTNGKIIIEETLSTNQQKEPEEIIHQIKDVITELLTTKHVTVDELRGIGLGAPGPLDTREGMITTPPNLPKWRNVPIVEMMRDRFSVPIVLENDANAATLAEKWVGSAQDSNNFIYLTISTGIGAGVYIDGQLLLGFTGNAGDVGHMAIDASKGTCTCGLKGCFEWIASGTAIARRGSELLGSEHSTKEIFDLYYAGHQQIQEFIENDVFPAIGTGCVNLVNIYDPEKIVIGGGVSLVGESLFEAVQEFISKYALNPTGCKTAVVPASCGAKSGVIGAAALILTR